MMRNANYPAVHDSLQNGVAVTFSILAPNEKLALIKIWLDCMFKARKIEFSRTTVPNILKRVPQCPNKGYMCADLGIQDCTSESEEEHRCAPYVQFVHLYEIVRSFAETPVMH